MKEPEMLKQFFNAFINLTDEKGFFLGLVELLRKHMK